MISPEQEEVNMVLDRHVRQNIQDMMHEAHVQASLLENEGEFAIFRSSSVLFMHVFFACHLQDAAVSTRTHTDQRR